MARTINPVLRAKKKQDILNAAMQCFIEKGFHSTSMKDVCKAAVMSPGALYRYFSSKDEIIIAIVEEERRKSDDFTLEIAQSSNLLDTLDDCFAQVIHQSNEPGYAQLSAEVYAELLRNEKATQLASDAHTKAAHAFSQTITKAMDAGKVDNHWDSDALGEILLGLIDVFDSRPALMRSVSDERLHKTVIQLINCITPKDS